MFSGMIPCYNMENSKWVHENAQNTIVLVFSTTIVANTAVKYSYKCKLFKMETLYPQRELNTRLENVSLAKR